MLSGDLYLYMFYVVPTKATCFTTLNKPIRLLVVANTNDMEHRNPLARFTTFKFNTLNIRVYHTQ